MPIPQAVKAVIRDYVTNSMSYGEIAYALDNRAIPDPTTHGDLYARLSRGPFAPSHLQSQLDPYEATYFFAICRSVMERINLQSILSAPRRGIPRELMASIMQRARAQRRRRPLSSVFKPYKRKR